MNGTLFIAALNSMANLDSLTGHGLANRKHVARLNYGPLEGHKQRKAGNFRKTGVFSGYLARSRPSEAVRNLSEPSKTF